MSGRSQSARISVAAAADRDPIAAILAARAPTLNELRDNGGGWRRFLFFPRISSIVSRLVACERAFCAATIKIAADDNCQRVTIPGDPSAR